MKRKFTKDSLTLPLNFHNCPILPQVKGRKCSHPSVSKEDWFQDPHGYQNPRCSSPLYKNGIILHTTYICRVCSHIPSFAWIQHIAGHLTSSSLTFWNILELKKKKFSIHGRVNPGIKPMDMKGQLYSHSL